MPAVHLAGSPLVVMARSFAPGNLAGRRDDGLPELAGVRCRRPGRHLVRDGESVFASPGASRCRWRRISRRTRSWVLAGVGVGVEHPAEGRSPRERIPGVRRREPRLVSGRRRTQRRSCQGKHRDHEHRAQRGRIGRLAPPLGRESQRYGGGQGREPTVPSPTGSRPRTSAHRWPDSSRSDERRSSARSRSSVMAPP